MLLETKDMKIKKSFIDEPWLGRAHYDFLDRIVRGGLVTKRNFITCLIRESDEWNSSPIISEVHWMSVRVKNVHFSITVNNVVIDQG